MLLSVEAQRLFGRNGTGAQSHVTSCAFLYFQQDRVPLFLDFRDFGVTANGIDLLFSIFIGIALGAVAHAPYNK